MPEANSFYVGKWTQDEIDVLIRYFQTGMIPMTVYQRIYKLNPNRSFEAVMRKIRHMKTQGWQKIKGQLEQRLRVGYFDIETTHLKANFGIILVWCIKPQGKKEIDEAVITREELLEGMDDKRIIEELLKTFEKYDILYTHYGSHYRFDIPFVKTRALTHNLGKLLPRASDLFIRDTYPIARRHLKLHSNRLDSIADMLGIKTKKSRLEPSIWRKAALGDPKSLEYILDHCRRDVRILEKVHKKLKVVEKPRYITI